MAVKCLLKDYTDYFGLISVLNREFNDGDTFKAELLDLNHCIDKTAIGLGHWQFYRHHVPLGRRIIQIPCVLAPMYWHLDRRVADRAGQSYLYPPGRGDTDHRHYASVYHQTAIHRVAQQFRGHRGCLERQQFQRKTSAYFLPTPVSQFDNAPSLRASMLGQRAW